MSDTLSCSDSCCVFRTEPAAGMVTNGGCRCLSGLTSRQQKFIRDLRRENAELRRQLQPLNDAQAMGAKGGPVIEEERLAFEAWMRGHCWALNAEWDGEHYRGPKEDKNNFCRHAMVTRQLWAAWRDRGALALAENAELRKKLEWQPIETAPRTGIALLLAQPWRSGYDTRLIGHYANGWVIHDGRELWDVEPTHWMPLPEPPL